MKSRATGRKLKEKKERKFKREKNGIEQAKLAYLSFLCEEDDINFFCTFENEWEQNNSRTDVKEAPLACYNNFSLPPSKSDAVEHSYLYTLLQSEDFTRDKRSCSSVTFIFDKLFFHFADFDEQLRRDIHLGRSFRKGKRRRRSSSSRRRSSRRRAAKEEPPRGETQMGAPKLCANKNRVFP
ncbi:hypothetical protein PCYB_004490, partial [Plasmodium cynomolgi strain B]